MPRFGFILTDDKTIINTFRVGDTCSKEFELTFKIQLLDYSNLELVDLEIKESMVNSLRTRIEYYLSLRNNENPDYNTAWEGRFDKSKMFVYESVLGVEMKLFQGNEDIIISFLARIYNQIEKNSSKLMLFLTDNKKEQREFLERN